MLNTCFAIKYEIGYYYYSVDFTNYHMCGCK